MRSDIEDAILGMYDSIERAREAQAAAGHLDQGARQGITLESIWIRLQLLFVTISLMRVSILMSL